MHDRASPRRSKRPGTRPRTRRGGLPLFAAFLLGSFACTDDDAAAPPSVADTAGPAEVAADPEAARLRELLGRVVPVLAETLEREELQGELPERTYTWREDRRSNQRDIDSLLDDALAALETSAAHDLRDQIRAHERTIRDGRRDIQDWRQRRIAAPTREELGTLDRVNPLVTSREEYDRKIANAEAAITAAESAIRSAETDLREELLRMGMNVGEEEVQILLATVTGDDQISFAAVFQNVRKVAEELERITVESGESLEAARRYYGMYVVLLEILDLAQNRMVHDIETVHLPKLEEFRLQAQKNVAEAEDFLRQGLGEPHTLQDNIAANQLTEQVIDAYQVFLSGQRDELRADNETLRQLVLTAENTFATVKLSSRVAELVRSTRRDLQLISHLEVPPLRGFSNAELREEFRRLSDAMVDR